MYRDKLLCLLAITALFCSANAYSDDSNSIVKLPTNNCEIRIWYNYQIVAIPVINEYWMQQGYDLPTRAKMAFLIRHNARLYSRFMMDDPDAVSRAEIRDIERYGDANGPSFDYLYQLHKANGLTNDESYQTIIDSASRTSTVYDGNC